jgi:hypothetical protein
MKSRLADSWQKIRQGLRNFYSVSPTSFATWPAAAPVKLPLSRRRELVIKKILSLVLVGMLSLALAAPVSEGRRHPICRSASAE